MHSFTILLLSFFKRLCVDDVAPKEEAAGDLETPAPEADTEPELNGEPDAEEETEHTTEVGRGSICVVCFV